MYIMYVQCIHLLCHYNSLYTYTCTGVLNQEKKKAEKVYFEKVVDDGKTNTHKTVDN